ncbi:MAG: hypothetical protein LBQ56_05075 [Synergistaceae bacterium]|jgi:hypothetical protein|nr:hypothetical protein [Synergistaceae bacterium]
MTTQMFDRIKYMDREYGLAGAPLEAYFSAHPDLRPQYASRNTACWRGYVARWEIRDEKLYLVGMDMISFKDATFKSIFPDAPDSGIFADWVTGELKCPHGKIAPRTMTAPGPVYEFTLLFRAENGVIRSVLEQKNF